MNTLDKEIKIERPKISIFIATSMDGYIARPDGSLDWLDQGDGSGEDCGFKKFFNSIDALVLGRNTYQTVTGFSEWPYKGKRTIVLSNCLQSVREEAELYRGDLVQLVSQLHADGIKHIWIDGGVTVSQFLKHRMVDQITISISPIILGAGIPLFSNIENDLPCRLVSSESYSNGFVQLRYELISRI